VRRAAACALALACALASLRPAGAFTQISVHAKRIDFYAERLSVVADGDVRTHYPQGPRVRADSLYVDLRTDRWLWAGHVHAALGSSSIEAVALCVDRDSRTMYALVTTGGLPRVERYTDFDLSSRAVVPPPEDAFVFPALRDSRPYIYSSFATIVPKVNIRFTPAFFPTSAGIVVPSPSYLYTYVANPNFGATPLAAPNFDQPYGLFGTDRMLTSAHFQYSSLYGAGIALTQQFVYGDRAYVALSAGPLRRYGDTAGLLAYERIDALRSQTLSASATQGLEQFLYRFNQAAPHGLLTLSLSRLNAQAGTDLGWASDAFPIARSGFTYRLHADYGFDHDPLGLLPAGADPAVYSTIWRTAAGAFVATPTFAGPFGSRMNVTLDGSRTWYAYPHRHDRFTLSSTIARTINPHLNLVGQIVDAFAGDAYPGRQLLFFPPPPTTFITPDGTPWPGYDAFIGFTTQRTYALTAYYTTIPPFVDLRVNLAYARDFPQFAGYGRPPYAAGFDLRYRPGGTVVVELGRSYTFGWANLRWSPQWTFSISQ
jgi:hypothetical protein